MFSAEHGVVILKRCLPITFHIKFPDMMRLTFQSECSYPAHDRK